MQERNLRGKWKWGLTALIFASLACNFSTPQGPEEPTPEVVTIVVTATSVLPTAVSEQGAVAIFNQDLNVRGGPGTAYAIQDQLPGGTKVDVLGKNETGTWWFIAYNGGTGWVSEPFTESNNTGSVPVVQAPAPPSSSSNSSSSDVGSSNSSGGSSSGGSSSGGSSGGSSGSGAGGSAPSDKDIKASVSIKNGSDTQNSEISYPDGDTTDRVTITPTGFDSNKTSGNLIFTLTCSGGTAKVNYNGGSVKSGSPGCNKTWTVFVTNDSSYSNLKIYLDSPGYVNWTLIVAGGG
jgi:uncharacterized protein YraI